MNDMIEITGCNLVDAVKAAYDLSVPAGLGFLHFQEGGLTDAEAQALVQEGCQRYPVDLDYVHGRACKFYVYRDGENRLWITDRWYDHTEDDLAALLQRIGVVR